MPIYPALPENQQPDTNAAHDALVAYLTNMTYADGTTKLFSGVEKDQYKDITDLVGVGKAAAEVYGNQDDTEHQGFSGYQRDVQAFYVLIVTSEDEPAVAATLLNTLRDFVVYTFTQHATLAGTGNIVDARVKPNSGKWDRIRRDGTWYKAYFLQVQITSDWFALVQQ